MPKMNLKPGCQRGCTLLETLQKWPLRHPQQFLEPTTSLAHISFSPHPNPTVLDKYLPTGLPLWSSLTSLPLLLAKTPVLAWNTFISTYICNSQWSVVLHNHESWELGHEHPWGDRNPATHKIQLKHQ